MTDPVVVLVALAVTLPVLGGGALIVGLARRMRAESLAARDRANPTLAMEPRADGEVFGFAANVRERITLPEPDDPARIATLENVYVCVRGCLHKGSPPCPTRRRRAKPVTGSA